MTTHAYKIKEMLHDLIIAKSPLTYDDPSISREVATVGYYYEKLKIVAQLKEIAKDLDMTINTIQHAADQYKESVDFIINKKEGCTNG